MVFQKRKIKRAQGKVKKDLLRLNNLLQEIKPQTAQLSELQSQIQNLIFPTINKEAIANFKLEQLQNAVLESNSNQKNKKQIERTIRSIQHLHQLQQNEKTKNQTIQKAFDFIKQQGQAFGPGALQLLATGISTAIDKLQGKSESELSNLALKASQSFVDTFARGGLHNKSEIQKTIINAMLAGGTPVAERAGQEVVNRGQRLTQDHRIAKRLFTSKSRPHATSSTKSSAKPIENQSPKIGAHRDQALNAQYERVLREKKRESDTLRAAAHKKVREEREKQTAKELKEHITKMTGKVPTETSYKELRQKFDQVTREERMKKEAERERVHRAVAADREAQRREYKQKVIAEHEASKKTSSAAKTATASHAKTQPRSDAKTAAAKSKSPGPLRNEKSSHSIRQNVNTKWSKTSPSPRTVHASSARTTAHASTRAHSTATRTPARPAPTRKPS